jgi:hypothetical protein
MGNAGDSFRDWVVRAASFFRPEPHPRWRVALLGTTDFVKKLTALRSGGAQYHPLRHTVLRTGRLGQYNRKHRKENEIPAVPLLKASQVYLLGSLIAATLDLGCRQSKASIFTSKQTYRNLFAP